MKKIVQIWWIIYRQTDGVLSKYTTMICLSRKTDKQNQPLTKKIKLLLLSGKILVWQPNSKVKSSEQSKIRRTMLRQNRWTGTYPAVPKPVYRLNLRPLARISQSSGLKSDQIASIRIFLGVWLRLKRLTLWRMSMRTNRRWLVRMMVISQLNWLALWLVCRLV